MKPITAFILLVIVLGAGAMYLNVQQTVALKENYVECYEETEDSQHCTTMVYGG